MKIVLSLALWATSLVAAAPMPGAIEGDYRMLRRVSIYDPERKAWRQERVEDCLHIGEALTDGRRPLRLFSVQANGHSCSLSGLAETDAGGLRLNAETDPGKSCGLRLRVERKTFNVEAKGVGCWNYCGARAQLDGIRYLRNGRRPPSAACAPEGR